MDGFWETLIVKIGSYLLGSYFSVTVLSIEGTKKYNEYVAVARRAHLDHPPRPRQWARVSRPSSVSYADILSSWPLH